MRSKWKGFYFNPGLDSKIFDRSAVITLSFLNKRVLIHNGRRFISLLIKESMLGYKFGEFVVTKQLGGKIHSKKKK